MISFHFASLVRKQKNLVDRGLYVSTLSHMKQYETMCEAHVPWRVQKTADSNMLIFPGCQNTGSNRKHRIVIYIN